MTPRHYDEDKLHIAVVAYLRAILPSEVIFLHPPNGGRRSKRDAAKLKAMGTLAGTPDLLFWWRPDGGALLAGAIELKSPTGYLQPEQKEWRDRLLTIGGSWALCRSIDQVRTTLLLWGVPTRESRY